MAQDAIVSVAAVLLATTLPVLLVIIFLRLATRGPDHPFKSLRYDAGNPPSGPGRFPALYQYLGYILVFIALDPVFMLLFVLPRGAGQWRDALLLSLAMVLILLPPLGYALRYARRMEYWQLHGRGR